MPAAGHLVVAEGVGIRLAPDSPEEDLEVGLAVRVDDGNRQIGAHQVVREHEARCAVGIGRRPLCSAGRPEVDGSGRRRLLHEVAVVHVEVERARVGDQRAALL